MISKDNNEDGDSVLPLIVYDPVVLGEYTNASQNLIGDFANSGITAGENGNFITNPNFANIASDDYHLSYNSPGIN